MILSDNDIRAAQGRSLVIEPFDGAKVTPIGYDVSVGDFVFILGGDLLEATDGAFHIQSGATVQILTKETLWLSPRLGGTVHSRVLLVSQGLTHISTTIDPCWSGPLLITMTNLSARTVELAASSTFATVVFHTLKTRTETIDPTFSWIREFLTEQVLNARSEEYVRRVAKIVADRHITEQFRLKLAEANRPLYERLRSRMVSYRWMSILNFLETMLLWAGLFAIASLHDYWNTVRPWFNDIPYDSKIFAAQVAAFIALLIFIRGRRRM
jgi:deoxycytidine triphosphate deaminase